MEELTRKEVLAERWADYPLLRALILERNFRWAVLALVGVAVVIGVSLPRVWVTTPRGLEPPVKVSLLDKVQAASLRRSAERFEAAGRRVDAARAWQSAVGNNAGDVELIRGALEFALRARDTTTENARAVASQALWLLRLTGTNQTDLELACRVFTAHNASELVCALVEPLEGSLSPALEASYAKALFLAHRVEEFRVHRERLGTKVGGDFELELCDDAYTVGWGAPAEAGAARQRLAEALARPESQVFVNRLWLAVCLHLLDLEGYRSALGRLELLGGVRQEDHLRLWRLLVAASRREEARALAEEYPGQPRSPAELEELARELASLDLVDSATRLLRRYAVEYGDSDQPWAAGVWIPYATLLIDHQRWEDLVNMGIELRSLSRAQRLFRAFGHFLEGRGEYGLGRMELADAAFERAASEGFASPPAGLMAGRWLQALGKVDQARRVLGPLEKEFENDRSYWQTMFEIAYVQKKDPVLLLRAAIRMKQLDPTSLPARVNYSAALLINRQFPEEAVEVTFDFYSANPNHLVARVNHSFALAMNQRFAEAAALVENVPTEALDENARTVLYLARFEVHAGLKQYDRAREDLGRIEPQYLFPNQVEWLEGMKARLPPPASPHSSHPF